jgi:hypothetical protein
MKAFNIVLLMIFCLSSLAVGAKKEIGSLEFRIGDIQVKNNGAKKWLEIDEGDKITVGDTLKTGKESKCEIKFNDGSLYRFGQNVLAVCSAYEAKKGSVSCKVSLLKGQLWSNVNKKDGKKKDFQVKSPVAVAAVIGTVFKFGFDGNLTEVSVLDGQVNVDLDKEVKEELNISEPDKKSATPNESTGPKEIPGPYEVTLSQWISIVKGEVISVRKDGKYSKSKKSVEDLQADWESFKK